MPAERSVDQRLSALERRVTGPGSSGGGLEERRTDQQLGNGPGTSGADDHAPPARSDEEWDDGPAMQTATVERSPANQSGDSSSETNSENPTSAESTDIEDRLEALESEVAELQAGLQALRGYVGNIDHVNESVERRANAALAAVERLEAAPTTPPALATATEPEEEAADDDEETTQAEEPDEPGLLDRLAALG